ncbi:disintegrin and metalloproteinase domain-containing protein 18 [Ctenodactylus gundi]
MDFLVLDACGVQDSSEPEASGTGRRNGMMIPLLSLYLKSPQSLMCLDVVDYPHAIKRRSLVVIYMITLDEKFCTLHLQKHSFLSPSFLVYTNNETGVLDSGSSYFMRHCHYKGFVAEIPNSLVTLSVCSGLRGFLQVENITYGIEPLESSARFEHIIYQVKSGNLDISLLTKNGSNVWQKNWLYKEVHLNSQEKADLNLLPQYLEMHIIVDKALYDYMGSEMMAVTQKIVRIIGLVSAMFTQFKLTVILSSLELWSGKNQISTDGDANDILRRFFTWKRNSPLLRPHHYPDGVSLEGFSVIVTQLLGLSVGLRYDDINNCSCPRLNCIMNLESVSSSGIKIFSNCSVNAYRNFVSKSGGNCLQNLSNLQRLDQNQAVCGNGILESNEECDCGNYEECQFKKCCDHKTCKLKGVVRCGSGPCCTPDCEWAVAGTPCRKSVDQECDFTEYCNGASDQCVPDTYAANGHLCRLGTAYCYNRLCQSVDDQCAKIFGKGAQGAPDVCFKEVNFPQERSGNCSFKESQSLSCGEKDVLCGKLACVQPHKNPSGSAAVESAVYSYTQGHVCLSITPGSSVRPDGRDSAYVADGTKCGPQMYCVNKTCRETHSMGYNCDAAKHCKGNGICNNFGNCHCFPDHRPPHCEFQIGSPGGSIDDGNDQKYGYKPMVGATHFSSKWFPFSLQAYMSVTPELGILGVPHLNRDLRQWERPEEIRLSASWDSPVLTGNVLFSGGFYESEGKGSSVTEAAHKDDDSNASLSPPPAPPADAPETIFPALPTFTASAWSLLPSQ